MNTSLSISRGLRRGGLAFFGGVAVFAAGVPCQKVVVSGDPEFPPYSWYDGKTLRGAGFDLVVKALESIGLPYEIRHEGPFLRMLNAAKTGRIDIVAELKDTPERREYLSFAPTPIFSNPSAVFVRRDSRLQYREWADLIRLRGGYTLGNKLGGGFDEYLETRLNAEKGPGIRENFLKLAAGRIDYFVSPYYPALNFLIAEKLESDFTALRPYVAEVDNFVGWARTSPCLHRLQEFDAAMAKLVKNGEATRLIQFSINAWRNNPVMVR